MDIKDVKRVTIAGCGTEGSQIASMVAYKGFETTVWLRSEGSVERAQPRLASVKKQIVDVLNAWKTGPAAYCRGLSDDRDLTPEQIDELIAQAEERLPKIRLTTSLEEAFGNADVVIECINEDPAQKTDLYEKIAPVMPEHTVLLTDSSTFLPSTFADATGRPDRYLTLHFANQIWRNNLTELMRHDRTSEESFDAGRAVLLRHRHDSAQAQQGAAGLHPEHPAHPLVPRCAAARGHRRERPGDR